MNRFDVDDRIESFFSEAKNVLGNDFIDLLFSHEIPFKKCARYYSTLPLRKLVLLFDALNVTLDSVVEGRVDFKTLASQFKGEESLPEKYLSCVPFSSRFTAMYMMDFITTRQGSESAKVIMQHNQLKPANFLDPRHTNNMLLPNDIISYIYSHYGERMVFEMGQNSVKFLQSSFLGKELLASKDLSSMLELFFQEMAPKHVEKNFNWRIVNLSDKAIMIAGKPNDEVIETLGRKMVINRPQDIIRGGFFKALPQIHGKYNVKIQKAKSLIFGDPEDVYKIQYSAIRSRLGMLQ